MVDERLTSWEAERLLKKFREDSSATKKLTAAKNRRMCRPR